MFGSEGVRGADVGVFQAGDSDGFGDGVGLRMGGECAVRGCLCVAAWETRLGIFCTLSRLGFERPGLCFIEIVLYWNGK